MARPIPTLKSQQQQQLREPPRRLRPAHPPAPPRAPSLPAGSAKTAAVDNPLPRTATTQPAAPSGQGPESASPDAARSRPSPLPRPLTIGPDTGRGQGTGRQARPPGLRSGQEPLLRADGSSAAVSTRPLSGLNLGKALPGERGREGFWHRNCSWAGAAWASRAGRGGASPVRLPQIRRLGGSITLSGPRLLVSHPSPPPLPWLPLLFELFRSSHLILLTRKPRLGELRCQGCGSSVFIWPPVSFQYSLHSNTHF